MGGSGQCALPHPTPVSGRVSEVHPIFRVQHRLGIYSASLGTVTPPLSRKPNFKF